MGMRLFIHHSKHSLEINIHHYVSTVNYLECVYPVIDHLPALVDIPDAGNSARGGGPG
jgi:hypothetical protein